nr:MAG TPA: hypothetical protein [Caudoviricetes sp.]
MVYNQYLLMKDIKVKSLLIFINPQPLCCGNIG